MFLTTKLPAASAVFWTALFETVSSASVADCLAWSRIFTSYIYLNFGLYFLPMFLPVFLAKDKNQ